MAQQGDTSTAPLIERRSIDYIPESERHGKLYSQFTLWMGANLQITAIVTGALAVVLGGVDISWIIGLVVPSVLYYLFARRGIRIDRPAQQIA